jgi:predicted AlkP superfamily phosphohydrolase/phosphomutase
VRAAALLLVCLGCGGAPEADRAGARGRVLLVGIDGATLRVLRPLLDAGRLPNLAALASQGVIGPLRSHRPLVSPRVWNSVATGKMPGKHGILSFARKDEAGKNQLYLGTDRRVPALWNIVSDAGLSVGVVNWWNTYPPERIRGVMVTDHALAEHVKSLEKRWKTRVETQAPVVFPTQLKARILEILDSGAPVTDFPDPFRGGAGFSRFVKRQALSRHFRRDDAFVRAALEVEAEIAPDLLMVLLPGIDRVSHWLWVAVEPDELYPPSHHLTPEQREADLGALEAYYEYTDTLIGALVSRFGEDDLVLVLSDHGFEAGVQPMRLTGTHETEKAQDGVLVARGRGILPGAEVTGTSVNDVTPTVLAWLGLPTAADMDGQPATFLDLRLHRPVASYDTIAVEHVGTQPSGVENQSLERPREVGYLE